MIEVRSNVKEIIKFIYFKNPKDAEETFKIVNQKISDMKIKIKKIEIKHGCSEFYEKYQILKILILKVSKILNNKDWEKFENIVDNERQKEARKNTLYVGSSLNLINLSDYFVIRNWLNYAKIMGDNSYEEIFNKKIEF